MTNPRAELKPSDRALLDEACDLLRGCAPLTWMHRGNMNDAAEYERTIVAFLDRARSLDAAAPAQAGEWVTEQFLVRLRAFADAEYFRGCGIAREDACLGWEQKAKAGKYGEVEHDAHRRLERAMGAHFGIYEAIRVALSAAPPAPQPATAGQPPTDSADSGSKSVGEGEAPSNG